MTSIRIGEKTHASVAEFEPSVFLGSAQTVRQLTKGEALVNGTCKCLNVGTAGTINFTDYAGVDHSNFPVTIGYNPIMISALLSGGTADDIWALY